MKSLGHINSWLKGWFLLITLMSVLYTTIASAKTDTQIWDREGDTVSSIDHSAWQTILDRHVIEIAKKYQAPMNYFNYKGVTSAEKQSLADYIEALKSVEPRDYPKSEQFAYWVNLYNALTVDLILKNYPLKSITKLGSWFSFGPWDEEIIKIAQQPLTLNDIEHEILRPIWKEPRIHYAVNCASIGCPNLSKMAFTADNTEALLEQAAKDYVNHPRGVTFNKQRLTLSKIYKWYAEDFGGSQAELLSHIARYADEKTREALLQYDGRISYEYDWGLNSLPTQ